MWGDLLSQADGAVSENDMNTWIAFFVGVIGPIGAFVTWRITRKDKYSQSRAEADRLEDVAQREAWSQITDTQAQYAKMTEALIEPMARQVAELTKKQGDLRQKVEQEKEIRIAEQTLRAEMETRMASLQRRFESVIRYVSELRLQARQEGWEPLAIPDELEEHLSEEE